MQHVSQAVDQYGHRFRASSGRQNYLRAAPVSAILLVPFDRHLNFPSSRVTALSATKPEKLKRPMAAFCRSACAITYCNVLILASLNCSSLHGECHLEPRLHVRNRTRRPVD